MRLGTRIVTSFAVIAVLAASSFTVRPASADDLKLKDGSKISGTIVGFDDNSFKVKTSYGFAVVQKDQVVSIAITPVAKTENAETKTEPAAEKAPAPISAPKKIDTATNAKPNATGAALTAKTAPSAVAASAPPPATAFVAAAPPAPASPPKPAAPEPIRESVNGNTYTNETYGFQMYKPPDWEVIASASTLMPGAIAAMGTGDQSTYLLVGQGPAGKTMASDEDQADRRLRGIMENFRPLDVQHLTVSGTAAVERRFRGSVDQRDWSGVVVLVPHGSQLYTIFGMTIADTDLVQIQENVIARAISSLQFTKQ